ncbi:hypothetical protein OH786_25340 [Streptomyces atratus]|uniref:hypothetical protein n=1 Tax=Streptomyces atratus TaxID=1893 RepID=UPI00324C0265
MREYDSEQVQKLVTGVPFVDQPTERLCPACGVKSVRIYMYRPEGTRRPTRITYAWCASCRHFKGWTGPDFGEIDFNDPLSSLSIEQRKSMQMDLESFMSQLDRLWEFGQLPQHFVRK